MRQWHDIEPADATELDLSTDLTITAPRNETGERCPWPWFSEGVARDLEYVRCFFCDARILAGVPHLDYAQHWRAIAPADWSRAAAWLKEGFTPSSVAAALACESESLLHAAVCNAERVLYVADADELRSTLDQLAALYDGDPKPFKVYRANGDERIEFRYGVTIFVKTIRRESRHAPQDDQGA
ncbi:hypothetical protein ACIP79_00550 [Streptomyces sp. NPDC088747]|uniref:hypothetical protein n=1 Tax=Streptomyces sp. NPDC088747 TaxID=3365886 RepID=UPI00380E2947